MSPASLFLPETVLERRDIFVHESSHAVIAAVNGLNVAHITMTIEPDKRSGQVTIGNPHVTVEQAERVRAETPPDVLVDVARRLIRYYLAGFAAEARLCHSVWARQYVIGKYSHDGEKAIITATEYGIESGLKHLWQETREQVAEHWQDIYHFADQWRQQHEREYQIEK